MISRIEQRTEMIAKATKEIAGIATYNMITARDMKSFASNLHQALVYKEITKDAAKNAVYTFQTVAKKMNVNAFATDVQILNRTYNERY